MPAPTVEYTTLFSTGNEPDLTQVNAEAKNGWELFQIVVSRPDWAYIMIREVIGPDHSKKKQKKKK